MEKRKINYKEFLNRAFGCFLGKAIAGNIGAPHEGQKMAVNLSFHDFMVDLERPNDDLDLQVLWLSVAEKKGPSFTSRDLLESFVKHCPYSPGEYAVMRKNYERGIYPPLSGVIDNDIYFEGMGCPIRSEIWACLGIGNNELLKDFCYRDGSLDHIGDAIYAEQFLAIWESELFFTQNFEAAMNKALSEIPKSRIKDLLTDTIRWSKELKDFRKVRDEILFYYGHPDCTNHYQNMGILMAALLLCDKDIIKASMMCVNAGFDTDCTAATAGAILGIYYGGEKVKEIFKTKDATYALGVTISRRSDRIFDLAEDVAKLAVEFTKSVNRKIEIQDAPSTHYNFEKEKSIAAHVLYENDNPVLDFRHPLTVSFEIKNREKETKNWSVTLKAEHGLKLSKNEWTLSVKPNGKGKITVTVSLPESLAYIYDKNRITLSVFENGKKVFSDRFGVVVSTPWKFTGPFWRTEPVATTQKVMKYIRDPFPYTGFLAESKHEGNDTDKKRHFHLNFEADTRTKFVSEKDLFQAPVSEKELAMIPEETFYFEDFTGFQGPATAYLSRILDLDEAKTLCVLIGFSSPFEFYLNGKLMAKRDYCENWTNENVHLKYIPFRKGENKMVLRMTRVNADARYNVTLSDRHSCGAHLVDFRSKNPLRW